MNLRLYVYKSKRDKGRSDYMYDKIKKYTLYIMIQFLYQWRMLQT